MVVTSVSSHIWWPRRDCIGLSGTARIPVLPCYFNAHVSGIFGSCFRFSYIFDFTLVFVLLTWRSIAPYSNISFHGHSVTHLILFSLSSLRLKSGRGLCSDFILFVCSRHVLSFNSCRAPLLIPLVSCFCTVNIKSGWSFEIRSIRCFPYLYGCCNFANIIYMSFSAKLSIYFMFSYSSI